MLPDHSLSLRLVRSGDQAGAEAATVEQNCLLAYPTSCFYTVHVHLLKEVPATVSKGLLYQLTIPQLRLPRINLGHVN